MRVKDALVKISQDWSGLVVKKDQNYYCLVISKLFKGWNLSGVREDEYSFAYSGKAYMQKVDSKGKNYKKGEFFTVFLLDFEPDGFIEFEQILNKDEMYKEDLFEGVDIYGVKNSSESVLRTSNPISELKYPITRKGCISLISPSYNKLAKDEYYVDINFKTSEIGGILIYTKKDTKEYLIGMSKEILTKQYARELVFYDLAKVHFLDEVKDLILNIESQILGLYFQKV